MRDVGKNIKKLREAKGMTQEALSEALFVTRQTVSNYETGRSRPDVDMLVSIAEILGVDVNTLIYGPPASEKKKQALRRLFIALGIFVLLLAAYIIVAPYAKQAANFRYNFFPAYCRELLLEPLMMFVFGWVLMQGVGILMGTEPLKKPWVKYGRIALIVLFVFLAAELIPFFCRQAYDAIQLFKLRGQSYSYSSHYPPVPLLKQILMLTINCPAIYTLLGALAWLFGRPKNKKEG